MSAETFIYSNDSAAGPAGSNLLRIGFEGLEEALSSLEAKETKDFELTFPENFREKQLAGKTAKADIKSHVAARNSPVFRRATAFVPRTRALRCRRTTHSQPCCIEPFGPLVRLEHRRQ